jgi:cytochrome P450
MPAESEFEKLVAQRPENVPADLVVDFDMFNLPGYETDVQLAYRAFQQSAPDIFWTPRNGGHWVATRAEDIEAMQRDYKRFSHEQITIPKKPDGAMRMIPLELNPPEHTGFRAPLTRALLPKVVNGLEAKIRAHCITLIEGFQPRGECEFVKEFGQVLPIVIFLDLVNLPREDRHYLLPLTDAAVRARTAEARMKATQEVGGYLLKTVRERRSQPGEDLLSQLVNTMINGERIGEHDAVAFASLVLFGGLDTVASMMANIARFLAVHPEHRRQLCLRLDDENFKRSAIEELLRRHGIASTARMITGDFEYKGVHFCRGDMILPPNMLFGLDERRVENPLAVDFTRPFPIPHAVFGNGPHTCPGAVLARREIKIFLEEWLKRIPDYEIKAGTTPLFELGSVNALLKLELCWSRTG